MFIDGVIAASLIASCSVPNTPLDYMQAIIYVESSYNTHALAYGNTGNVTGYLPKNEKEARDVISIAKKRHLNGKSIAIGLGQIQTWNIKALKLSVDRLFSDSCYNIRVASSIFQKNLKRSCPSGVRTNECIEKALRAYNTGKTKITKAGQRYIDLVDKALSKINKNENPTDSKFLVINSGNEKVMFYINNNKIGTNDNEMYFRKE